MRSLEVRHERKLPMGYDLHITRALDWTSNRGLEITHSEWWELVAADPELVEDPDNGPLAVQFGRGWFDWFEGNIFCTDPESAAVTKMFGIAERFSAAVQGDDGEIYDSVSHWIRSRRGSRREAGRADDGR